MLSCLPESEVARIIDAIGVRLSVYGDLDVTDLLAHVERARQNGFAWITKRAVPGVSAVGLPIRSQTGAAVAAVTVATTQARMTERHVAEILPMLNDAALEIAHLLRQ